MSNFKIQGQGPLLPAPDAHNLREIYTSTVRLLRLYLTQGRRKRGGNGARPLI